MEDRFSIVPEWALDADTVDRALAELVQLGAVQVEHRWAGRQRLTNRYRIRTSRPTQPFTGGPPAGSRAAPHGCGYPDRCHYPHRCGRPNQSGQDGRTDRA